MLIIILGIIALTLCICGFIIEKNNPRGQAPKSPSPTKNKY